MNSLVITYRAELAEAWPLARLLKQFSVSLLRELARVPYEEADFLLAERRAKTE